VLGGWGLGVEFETADLFAACRNFARNSEFLFVAHEAGNLPSATKSRGETHHPTKDCGEWGVGGKRKHNCKLLAVGCDCGFQLSFGYCRQRLTIETRVACISATCHLPRNIKHKQTIISIKLLPVRIGFVLT